MVEAVEAAEAVDGSGPAFQCREIRQRGPGKSADPCAYKGDCFIKARPLEPKFFWLAKRISMRLCVCMMESDIFKALADPTRRAIFEKLAEGSMNASALRTGMAISQPAMSQHLAVLRKARLVREQRQGRFVNYEVDPKGLTLIAGWLAKYRAYWPARMDALDVLLKDMDQ